MAIKVSGLDINGDWTLGAGLANYIEEDDAIAQNVVTRIKSFQNDWFLDTSKNIDWLNILGSKNNELIIISEVTRVVKETNGVINVNSVEVISTDNRNATIEIDYDSIYNENILSKVEV